jgi:acetyl esterase
MMHLSPDLRAQFDADFDGPARPIYEFVLGSRRIPSTKRMMAEALRAEMGRPPPDDAPKIVVPPALHRDVSRERVTLPGSDGAPDIRAFVYHPSAATAPPPLLVYYHGGGWCTGEPEGTDLIARKLSLLAGVAVLNVAYRLAPEHPYPAGLDDCVAAYQWARAHAAERLGADANRVAVGGDSAGGNLAAAVTLRVRDADQRSPDANLLICPATDFRFEEYESCRRLGPKGTFYDLAFLGYVRSAYVPQALWEHPHVSPMRGDLRAFGPTLILASGEDPLYDDNRTFAARLREAGNAVELHDYPAMPHVFIYFLGLTREEDDAYQAMAAFLRRHLAAAQPAS